MMSPDEKNAISLRIKPLRTLAHFTAGYTAGLRGINYITSTDNHAYIIGLDMGLTDRNRVLTRMDRFRNNK